MCKRDKYSATGDNFASACSSCPKSLHIVLMLRLVLLFKNRVLLHNYSFGNASNSKVNVLAMWVMISEHSMDKRKVLPSAGLLELLAGLSAAMESCKHVW